MRDISSRYPITWQTTTFIDISFFVHSLLFCFLSNLLYLFISCLLYNICPSQLQAYQRQKIKWEEHINYELYSHCADTRKAYLYLWLCRFMLDNKNELPIIAFKDMSACLSWLIIKYKWFSCRIRFLEPNQHQHNISCAHGDQWIQSFCVCMR